MTPAEIANASKRAAGQPIVYLPATGVVVLLTSVGVIRATDYDPKQEIADLKTQAVLTRQELQQTNKELRVSNENQTRNGERLDKVLELYVDQRVQVEKLTGRVDRLEKDVDRWERWQMPDGINP